MRKTKIICTLGPSTEDDQVLRDLMIEGMNVTSFNFSHGDHAQHAKNLARVTKLREELGLPIAALLDTKGPEIRVKTFKDGRVELKNGQEFTLTTREVEGDETMVSITYEDLVNDVKVGNKILIDDGKVELTELYKQYWDGPSFLAFYNEIKEQCNITDDEMNGLNFPHYTINSILMRYVICRRYKVNKKVFDVVLEWIPRKKGRRSEPIPIEK